MKKTAKHTLGPWRVDETTAFGANGVWTDYVTHLGNDSKGCASQICSMGRIDTSAITREQRNANSRLIASAPAMELALSMLAFGVARLERTGALVEFCFDGLRYSHNGDWNAMLNTIGWGKARAALAKAVPA